jgi:hypothetical protein
MKNARELLEEFTASSFRDPKKAAGSPRWDLFVVPPSRSKSNHIAKAQPSHVTTGAIPSPGCDLSSSPAQ